MISHQGHPYLPDDLPPLIAERSGGARRMVMSLAMLGVFLGLAVLGWFAVEESRHPKSLAEVPVIKADADPFKVEPQDPGGMDIPNRDKQVYDSIAPSSLGTAPETEEVTLRPEAEQPLPREVIRQLPVPSEQETAIATVERELDPEQNSVTTGLPEKQPTPDSGADAPAPVAAQDAENAKAAAPKAPVDKPKTQPPVAAPKEAAAAHVALKSLSRGDYVVQLGSYRSNDGADKGWDALKQKFPGELGGLQYSVKEVELGSKGTFYRLYAGPLPDKEAGQTLCNSLTAKKQGCILTNL